MFARKIREKKIDLLSQSSQKLIGIGSSTEDDLLYGLNTTSDEIDFPCSSTLKKPDKKTGVLFRTCMIDYTSCTQSRCIKKLL